MVKRLMVAFTAAAALITALAMVATAEPEVPSPYGGLKNPFSWDDAAAQQAGQKVYQQSCLGCHGARGDGVAAANFGTAVYAEDLQNRPDFTFWLLSEGEISEGMPPFKSSLSEKQRWQVLTYIWSLGKQASPPAAAASTAKPPVDGAVLQLGLPKGAQSGRSLSLTAYLHDGQGRPIADATVKFLVNSSFFAKGLMEMGDAATDKDGKASLDTVLAEAGDVQIVAQYQGVQDTAALTLAPNNRPFYRTSVGIHLPAAGSEVFIGPVLSEGLGEMGQAPLSALRLPGGTLSWLMLPVAAVLLIWSTYLYVMYQVLRISPSGKTLPGNTKIVPYALLVILALIGLSLALKVAIGPYSQFHLLP